jgi:tRNA nucleotidyltransferase/poly(A) polymerase
VLELAQQAGIKAVPTGIQHGTVTLICNHRAYEVTTLRADIRTHGRHADVIFGTDWHTDARRRDFTINAVYADANGELFDPLGGISDMADRRVRFIGSPVKRIGEDFLRILRFFRFSSWYANGILDADGLVACVDQRIMIQTLSAERIGAEFFKLLAAPFAGKVLETMKETGILQVITGQDVTISRFLELVAIEDILDLPPDPVLRLVSIAQNAEILAKKLKLSRTLQRRIAVAGEASSHFTSAMDAGHIHRLLYKLGRNSFNDSMLMAASSGKIPQWQEIYRQTTSWTKPKFPVTGADILAVGVDPGPQVGKILHRMEEYWLTRDFQPDKKQLLDAFLPPA